MTFESEIIKEIVGEKPRVFIPTKASWLAGVIDGEGSIGLYDFGKEGRRVEIQMSNTNEEFVKVFKRTIGCGSNVTRFTFSGLHKGRKPIYHFSLKGSARCYLVLKQILPYLIIKKGKADKILKEIEANPFGRWKNATKEARDKQSWQNPIHRQNRINGLQKILCGGESVKKALITGVTGQVLKDGRRLIPFRISA